MTATTAPYRRGLHPTTAPRLTFGGILSSEWMKLVTLRSTAAIAVGMLILTVPGSWLQSIVATGDHALSLHPTAAHVTAEVIAAGTAGGQLVIVVLAILILSGEYSTGTITTTLTSVPRRLPVLAAKAIVITLTTIVLAVVGALLSYAATLPRLHAAGLTVPLLSAATARGAAAAAITLVIVALFALLVATVLRNTAAAIAVVMAVLFVLPAALSFAIGDTGVSPSQFTLTYAAQMITSALTDPSTAGHVAPDAAVLAAWLGVPAIAAITLLKRRDA